MGELTKGIPDHVMEKLMAAGLDSDQAVRDAGLEGLTAIKGIGPATAADILEALGSEDLIPAGPEPDPELPTLSPEDLEALAEFEADKGDAVRDALASKYGETTPDIPAGDHVIVKATRPANLGGFALHSGERRKVTRKVYARDAAKYPAGTFEIVKWL